MATKSKIVAFPSGRPVGAPLDWICRRGLAGHKQRATLHVSGDLPVGRVVVDALFGKRQKSLDVLQAIPDAHRTSRFVGQTLVKTVRHARGVAALDLKANQADKFGVINPEHPMKSLTAHASAFDRKRRVLENVPESTDVAGRAVQIAARVAEVERGWSLAGGKRR